MSNPYQPFNLAGTLAAQSPRRAFDPNPFPALRFAGTAIGTLANVLPPGPAPTPDVEFINGVPTVQGAPLACIASSARDLVFNHPGSANQASGVGVSVSQVYDGSTYGDSSVILLTFGGPGSILALARPTNTRTMLLVVNDTVVGPIRYNWDKAADAVGSIPIAAGGNRNFTPPAVPQGNLYIYSTGAGNVLVEYMNKDIRQ